jgi:hypothetical protein
MAKAIMTTLDGATVTIEGSQDEVAALLTRLGGNKPTQEHETGSKTRLPKSKPTPMGLISDLIAEGFFREPRELGAVRLALRERGHFYPVTTLSPLMLRLVRRKELRRIKEKKRWTYVS